LEGSRGKSDGQKDVCRPGILQEDQSEKRMPENSRRQDAHGTQADFNKIATTFLIMLGTAMVPQILRG
jgi:hypothetical protein